MAKKQTALSGSHMMSDIPDFGDYGLSGSPDGGASEAPVEAPDGGGSEPSFEEIPSSGRRDASRRVSPARRRVRDAAGGAASALVTVKVPLDLKGRLDVAKMALSSVDGRSWSTGELIGALLEKGLKGVSKEAWERTRVILGAMGGHLE